MHKPKRKLITPEQYNIHQARAAVLLPLAVTVEMLITMGLIVGIITGAAGAPLTSLVMMGFSLFGLWMAWNIFSYVTILRDMQFVVRRQYSEAARVQRLLDHSLDASVYTAQKPNTLWHQHKQ